MIFGSSQAYESRRQRRITGQEVNAVHTLAAPTWLWCSQTAITFDPKDYPDRVPIRGATITPDFKGQNRMQSICMLGSIFIHIVTSSVNIKTMFIT
jgi:hypothetical protein